MNTDPSALLGTILNTATDAIITIDASRNIVVFNAGAEVIFGYTADEMVGQPIDLLLPENLRAKHGAQIRSFVEGEKVSRMMRQRKELLGLRKDGSTFAAEASVSKISDNGATTATVILRDIGPRKEMEKQLRQIQKIEAMGQLTGGVAHEFNNLLLVILGNIEILQERLEPDDPRQKYLVPMTTSARRGAELTQSLLAFSRKQRLEFRHVDLNEIVRRTHELLKRTLGGNFEIVTDTAEGLWLTSADTGQVEAALLNLALNARDAMPDGGVLTVRTRNLTLDEEGAAGVLEGTPGDYVVLEVSDTGTGMTPEVIEKAFDPFFTTKEVGSGTGLGLSVVHGFAKQSKGFAEIESALDQGTTVRLGLPRGSRADTSEAANTSEFRAPTRGTGTILVVEDEDNVRALVKRELTDLGYNVIEARNGDEALDLLVKPPQIDLLFTDVVLSHGLSGPAVARKIRQSRPDLKVLFTSGYTDQELEDLTVAGEEVALLRKPYQKFELAEFIASNLEAGDSNKE